VETQWADASFNDNITVGYKFDLITSEDPYLEKLKSPPETPFGTETSALSRRISSPKTSSLTENEKEGARNETLDILEGRTTSKVDENVEIFLSKM
jgi:hypothetical protein